VKYSQNPAAVAMRRLRANNPGFRQRDMVRCREYRNRKLAENPRYEADRKAAWRLRKKTESHAAKFQEPQNHEDNSFCGDSP
jgi:hypothetical protein